ncbi:Crp/Fnr family transcriptional regulator [Mesorhizobium sp. BR1-1-9]|uniref:Crp/Fnr family transcriptional regulator n=1 Tax=unclassified Mesorhizobium TaxID=325217 RepID=UPI00112AC3BE|nr:MULTISPECIES: Crp/Fnr family transcriptional regulator [unclassified Mesorhizobium]MBZ9810351.1 Crp/Fnr family transcriptional regulator [Mesorhizobium sp. ESP-6-2]MBZ9872204.1 Crp/Fnr family transcriptional regulator [Mesorhizobium sp. BR1-1-9]MBZ9943100.1 Crp/Fnr family transcriptional regulator [Mesorhizobium sp. BR1-1-13]TPM24906.1 Crp/Fnr family transcriptional regulator [Mesorhizobium sp. B2-2-2]
MKQPPVRYPGPQTDGEITSVADANHMHGPDLKNIEHFSNVKSSTLIEIDRRCRWLHLNEGDVLVPAGESVDRLFFLLEGELRALVYTRNGKIVSLPPAHRGSLVNGIALSGDIQMPYSVEAAGPCTVASIGSRAFLEIVKQDPEALHAVVQLLVERQQVLVEHIVELSTLNVRSRVHKELLRLCAEDIGADGSARISPIPTHTDLAHRIGTHREAVARELSYLQNIGLVLRHAKELYVPDVSRIADLVAKSDD